MDGEAAKQFNRTVSTDEIIDKSSKIGYKLEVKPDYDKGVDGRWAACHAEKQLAMLGANSITVSKNM